MSNLAFDRAHGRTLHVVQGDYAVSADPHVLMTTILGSCVATCLFDPEAGVGGMNHFLLPGDVVTGGESGRVYGVNAMELLINGLLKAGADRRRLKAKLFGGARLMGPQSRIGEKNAEFARLFLRNENIPCVGESLGGILARRVQFWPATGRARQRLMSGDDAALQETIAAPKPAIDDGEVEFF